MSLAHLAYVIVTSHANAVRLSYKEWKLTARTAAARVIEQRVRQQEKTPILAKHAAPYLICF